jgi:excisionase family DNA binding protein
MRVPEDGGGDLLTPREVAEIFGVRTTTIARWSREGRLTPIRTPGGHRRYTRAEICAVLDQDAETDRQPTWGVRRERRTPVRRAGASGRWPRASR